MDDVTKVKAEPTRVKVTAAKGLIADALGVVGMEAANAVRCAELMVEADLTGADAHGVFRIPHYIKRIQAGGINVKANITVDRTAPATAMVDGDNGMGHLVMAKATELAAELARENGVAWVGARRSNHAGAAGIYPELLVEQGMASIYSVVASANHMPVWGGAEQMLGTNPIAFGLPAGEEPHVILDVATTIASYGTVKAYKLEGRQMPEGWMVDGKTGQPITDPALSGEGLLMPFGEYKGSGLAIVLGLLAGPLNGAAFGKDIVDFNADQTAECNTGHFIIALDIKRFAPLDRFKADIDRHLRDLRKSKTLPGVDKIRLPGDMRRARRIERTRDGLSLVPELIRQLDAMADELKITPIRKR
jgi:LDH2 family malate/lactate/ureidoglycolate dehydrogenase